jgi:hypothetical protein
MKDVGRSLTNLLREEAKRRPIAADLVNRIGELTDEEIDTVKVPLPWYRKALRELKKEYMRGDGRHEGLNKWILRNFVEGIAPDPVGNLRRWEHADMFIDIDRGNQIEVRTGEYIWFDPKGGVWIGTIYAKVIDYKLQHSIDLGSATKWAYKQKCRERLEGHFPAFDSANRKGITIGR